MLTYFFCRIRATEAEEKRHERKHDGRSFHGTKEKVMIVSFQMFYVHLANGLKQLVSSPLIFEADDIESVHVQTLIRSVLHYLLYRALEEMKTRKKTMRKIMKNWRSSER